MRFKFQLHEGDKNQESLNYIEKKTYIIISSNLSQKNANKLP